MYFFEYNFPVVSPWQSRHLLEHYSHSITPASFSSSSVLLLLLLLPNTPAIFSQAETIVNTKFWHDPLPHWNQVDAKVMKESNLELERIRQTSPRCIPKAWSCWATMNIIVAPKCVCSVDSKRCRRTRAFYLLHKRQTLDEEKLCWACLEPWQ